jgi:hypothetical protein
MGTWKKAERKCSKTSFGEFGDFDFGDDCLSFGIWLGPRRGPQKLLPKTNESCESASADGRVFRNKYCATKLPSVCMKESGKRANTMFEFRYRVIFSFILFVLHSKSRDHACMWFVFLASKFVFKLATLFDLSAANQFLCKENVLSSRKKWKSYKETLKWFSRMIGIISRKLILLIGLNLRLYNKKKFTRQFEDMNLIFEWWSYHEQKQLYCLFSFFWFVSILLLFLLLSTYVSIMIFFETILAGLKTVFHSLD